MDRQKIKTLIEQVGYCLRKYPETRNSDIALTIRVREEFFQQYLRKDVFHGKNAIQLSSLFVLPREDTIKRVRAKIQNKEGRFLPTDWKVAKKRGLNEEVRREAMKSVHLGNVFEEGKTVQKEEK